MLLEQSTKPGSRPPAANQLPPVAHGGSPGALSTSATLTSTRSELKVNLTDFKGLRLHMAQHHNARRPLLRSRHFSFDLAIAACSNV